MSSIITEFSKDYSFDFKTYKVFDEENQRFFIEAPLQTPDLLPKDLLKKYLSTVINKELRTFHIPPEKDPNSFIGVVNKAWWNEADDLPYVRLEIYGDTATERAMRKLITDEKELPLEKRTIKGISGGVVQNYNTKGELVKLHFREVSLARNPVCDICKIQKIILNEKNILEGIKLSENQDKQIVKLYESQIEELKQKIANYEVAVKQQLDTLEKQKTVIDQQRTVIENYDKKIPELEKKLKISESLPKRLVIVNYEQLQPNTDEGKKRLEELSNLDAATLQIIIKGYERIDELNKRGLTPSDNTPTFENQMTDSFAHDPVNPDKMKPEEYKKYVDTQLGNMESIGGL